MAYGEISDPLDGALFQVSDDIYIPKMLRGPGNIIMVMHKPGLTVTAFGIGSDGSITRYDIRQYDASASVGSGQFIHISGNVYAATYNDSGTSRLITFTCDENGDLGLAVIDSQSLGTADPNALKCPGICKLENSSNIYIVTWDDNLGDDYGRMSTYTINDDGTIDNVPLDSWVFDLHVSSPNMIQIDGKIYAISYQYNSSARVRACEIQDDGTITGSISYKDINTSHLPQKILQHIDGDYYFAAYQGFTNLLNIGTWKITSAGAVTAIDSWVDAGSGEAGGCAVGYVVSRNEADDGKLIYVVHSGSGAVSDNILRTFEISNEGIITKSFIDSKAASVVSGASWGIPVTDIKRDMYVMVYRAGATAGWIETRTVEAARNKYKQGNTLVDQLQYLHVDQLFV